MYGLPFVYKEDKNMNEKQIVNIAIDHIFPHPDNPRKNLGDLTEIAESIKKRGIMQNLTVLINPFGYLSRNHSLR